MQHRTPSFSRISISSNVRRRSVGATAHRNHADRLPVAEHAFPSVHSQPIVSLGAPLGEPITRLQAPPDGSLDRSQSELVVAVHSEEGYHVYSSLSTSNEMSSPSQYSGESQFVNVTLDPASSGHANDTTNADITNADETAIESSDSSPSSNDIPRSIRVVHLNVRATPSDSNGDCQHPPEKTSPTILGLDLGHSGLIPSVGTTNNFTNKWPRPKALKYFEAFPFDSKGSDVGRMGLTGAPTLEEGRLSLSHLSKWTGFKWCLLFSVMSVFACGCAGLILALMTWFNAWDKANVMAVADHGILILVTLSGCVLLLTSFVGITGTLLNSRPILAVYTLLLWPAFVSLLSVGYTSYRRSHHTLDNKLSYAWSRYYTAMGRQLIQDSLQCCGYFSSLHEASPSKHCYLRTPLPGCKDGLLVFERHNLRTIWKAAFSVAPLHLVNMVVAIICANHATNMFGKRILPKQYRLSPHDVKADAEKLIGVAFLDPSLDSPRFLAEEKALIEKSE